MILGVYSNTNMKARSLFILGAIVLADIRDEIEQAMDYRRFARACAIPDDFITFHIIDITPEFFLYASIRGSGAQTYSLFIDEEDHIFYHDCPDFLKGDKICKHIAKFALCLPENYARRILTCYFSCRVISNNEFLVIRDEIDNKIANKRTNFVENGWKENAHYENILRGNKSSCYWLYSLELYAQIILQTPDNFSQFLTQIPDLRIVKKILNALIAEIPVHLRSWVCERLKFKDIPNKMDMLLNEINLSCCTNFSIKNSHQMPILL